jgi:AraC-like DNA-binding protein
MKLIFHYADTYWHHPPHGNKTLLPHCFLIGQLTRPYVVEPLGITGTFVTRFHPEGFLPFTTLPIKDMENTAVPLSTLFGKEGEELGDSILQARDTAARIQHIETFLLAKLTKQTAVDNIIKSAVETILRAKGQFSIQEHSQHTQINRRQLTRKFSSAIGLSPKQLSKTIRLQATLKKLLNGEVKNFTELALENEYYDQAHFIKDFKEFTGLTPKEFYGDHLKMSLIFDSPQ